MLLNYYDEDYKTTNLLIALTKHLIKMTKENTEITIGSKAERIMTECLENSNLSNEFRKELAAIGTILARNNKLKAFIF